MSHFIVPLYVSEEKGRKLVYTFTILVVAMCVQTTRSWVFFGILIWKRKKSEVPKISEQSWLEAETIRSRIFGLFTWAICELTNAGGKNSKSFRWPQQTTCTSIALAIKRSLRTDTKLSFRAFWVERRWWASWSSLCKALISLGLAIENTGLIIFLAILISAAPRSICRLGK